MSIDTLLSGVQTLLGLAVLVLLIDLFTGRRITRVLTGTYESFDEKNADVIVAKTGMQREFIKGLYRLNRHNPKMHDAKCISFSMAVNGREAQQVTLFVYGFGYAINSVSMPEGTHEYKRTMHTFIIENRLEEESPK